MTADKSPGGRRDPRMYVRVLNEVSGQVRDGTLVPGKPTPTIGALARRFGCTRQTAAKALSLLTRDGELVLYPGLGYYVAGDEIGARQNGGSRP